MMHHQWNLVVTVFLGSRVFRVPFMAVSFNFYGFEISIVLFMNLVSNL